MSPLKSPPRVRPTRYCGCGARIASDNPDDTCSPCQVSSSNRERERIDAADQLRRTRVREQYRQRASLVSSDIPVPTREDKFQPLLVQEIVFQFARTGSYARVGEILGMDQQEVRLCIRRQAARDIIEYLVEEGLWPEGQSTGKGN